MNARTALLRVAPWFLCVIVFGCSLNTVADMNLSGKLVYASSEAVYELDLSSLEKRIIYAPRHLLAGHDITRVGNGMVVETFDSEIYFVSKAGDGHRLGQGAHPVYVSKHRTLFFYSNVHGEPRSRLYKARLNNGELGPRQEIDAGPFGVAPAVLVVSKDEIVFKRDTGELFKYNLRSGDISKLPIEGCYPVAWRSTTSEMLCEDHEARSEYLISLDGRTRTKVPLLNRITHGPYLPTRDSLLGSDTRFSFLKGEVLDLYLCDFSNKTLHKIKEAAPIGAGNAFWVEEW